MKIRSLNRFLKQREAVIRARNKWLGLRYGIEIAENAKLSLSSKFISKSRGSIFIDSETLIAFNTLIYSHDPLTDEDKIVKIGKRCFIGGGSVIAPGVTIGDSVIVGAGSVVLHDVASDQIVGGNPLKILRVGVQVGPYGRLKEADENTRKMWTIS